MTKTGKWSISMLVEGVPPIHPNTNGKRGVRKRNWATKERFPNLEEEKKYGEGKQ